MTVLLAAALPTIAMQGRRMTVPVSPRQGEFLASRAQYTLFCGGVGSGKTKAGAFWSVREIASAPGIGLVGANTYQQLVRVTLRAFLETLEQQRYEYRFGTRPPPQWGPSAFQKHDMIASVMVGSALRQVVCVQLTSFDVHRGLELRWAWLDETRDTKEDAFNVIMGRLRGGPVDARRVMAVTTTPDGFNWLHGRFVAKGEHALADRKVVHATSHDNPWLPADYAASLLKNYSPRLAQQEVGGRFISLTTGQAFAEFNRVLHVSDAFTYQPDLPLIHSWDFNRNPMCSVVIQVEPATGCAWVIDEIHIEGSALTTDATTEFLRRYREHRGSVVVYGDSTGNARDHRTTTNDYEVIQEAYGPVFKGRLEMRQRYNDPPVVQSVQDVNSLLMNAAQQVRLRVRSHCEWIIRDLEQVCFKPGTRELDKTSDKTLTHHSDALRYYVTTEYPAVSRAATGLMPVGI